MTASNVEVSTSPVSHRKDRFCIDDVALPFMPSATREVGPLRALSAPGDGEAVMNFAKAAAGALGMALVEPLGEKG